MNWLYSGEAIIIIGGGNILWCCIIIFILFLNSKRIHVSGFLENCRIRVSVSVQLRFKENVVGQSYLCVKLEKHVEISTQEGSQILSELVFFKGVCDSRVGI